MVPEKYKQQFIRFRDEHTLFRDNDRLLLAVSGGVDSVAMGWLFHELAQPFGVVHCNFKLRKDASDNDEAFVRSLALQWQVPFFTRSFSTASFAEQEGVSIQMAARELRYQYFEEVAGEHGYSKIATAHHIDDAFETLLLNLVHGTGFRGLAGILPVRGNFVRPMLAFSRTEIEELARTTGIEWREDASNKKDDYQRNKVRHHVLPVLSELNPAFSATLKDTFERLWMMQSHLERAVGTFGNRLEPAEGGGSRLSLDKLESSEHLLFFEGLRQLTGLGFRQFRQLMKAAEGGQSGKLFYTPGHVLNVDRGQILIRELGDEPFAPLQIGAGPESVTLPIGQLSATTHEMPLPIDRRPEVAMLDFDKLSFPLLVRRWKEGDSFVPLGMKGQKKLSDFMIDVKIPLNLKSSVLVLLSGGKIAWVIGKRIDDRFKIGPGTKRVYRLELC